MNGNVPKTVKEIGIYMYGKLELFHERIENLDKKFEEHIQNCPTKQKLEDHIDNTKSNYSWIKWLITSIIAVVAVLIAYFS